MGWSPNTTHLRLPLLGAILLSLALPQMAAAALSITPITWDVVGLDSNRPLTSGPELFPAGAEVCTTTASANLQVDFIWPDGNGSSDPYINLRPGSLSSLNFTGLGAGECVDAYFEIQLTRDVNAFGNSREYRIEATDSTGTVSTPSPRQILIEYLVSQNRNTTLQIRYGQQADMSDWVIYGAGSINLAVGETYFIELTTQTSTSYEELQSFLTLSNTIFQVLSVETTYTDLTGANVPTPNPRLWADGCVWDSDPNSPNYNSCLDVGKAGGTVVTTYEIKIISGGGDSVGLEALIYDRSGSSFHYNTDFSESPGEIVTYDPSASGFSKRFLPSTISPGAVSTLLFTITNPNPVELTGYTFTDSLPAGVEVANPPNASSSCGGTWAPAAMDTALSFDIGAGVIGPNGSCSIRVDVTAASSGTYDNVSDNLFLGGLDTGNNATATLTVNTGPIPPPCAPGTEAVRWEMDGMAVPPPFTSKHADVSTATASFTVGGTPTAPTNSMSTTDGNPVNSWVGRGWSTKTTPSTTGPGSADASYFEFTIDTSAFSSNPAVPLSVVLDVNPLVNGDWATSTDIALNVHASADGGAFSTVYNTSPLTKVTWTTLGPFNVTPGLATTTLRVNISGRNGTKPDAELAIDNLIVSGCGPGAGAVPDPPELAKAFSPNPIGVGKTSLLTFTLTNGNASPLTEAQFTDTLPAGMTVANPAGASNTCGGTWAPSPGESMLSFSGGTIPAMSSCTLTVDVTASTVGDLLNVTDFITALESGQNATPSGSGSDTLTVLAPPSIEKAFDPELVLLGVTPNDASKLTFSILNPNPGSAISGVSFSDNLPGSLVVANPPNASSGCGGTWTPSAGAGSVTFSGGTIAAGGTCLVSVDVTGPAGTYNNVSSAVSHLVGGVPATNGLTPAATVVIDDPIPGIVLSKQVGLTNDPDGAWYEYLPVLAGTDVYYKLIVENVGETPLVGIFVTDPDVTLTCAPWPNPLPLADAVEPPPHIAVCIVGPFTAMAGVHTNTATAAVDAAEDDDSATYATVGLTLDKVASPLIYTAAGQIINYTFTVTNTGAAILASPASLNDALVPGATCPALSMVGNGDNFFDPGEVLVCTGSYTTQAADVVAGSVNNTATASVGGFTTPSAMATVTLVAPALTTSKVLTSNADGDGSGTVTEGDVLTYTVTATNSGNIALTNVVVTDSMITPTGGTTPCASVPVAGTCTLIGTYVVTAADVTAGTISNTGTGDSDETPPSTSVVNTPVSVPLVPQVGLAKRVTAVTDQGGGVFDIDLAFIVENLGNVGLTSVQVTDNLTATFPAPVTFAIQAGPVAGGTLAANGAFNGAGDQNLLNAAGSTLAVGASGTIAFTVRITLNGATGPFSNTATATADSSAGPTSDISDDGADPDPNGNGTPDDPGEDDPTPISVATAPDVVATKTSSFNVATQDNDGSGTLTPGDDLTYSVQVTNNGTADALNVFLSDTPDANTTLVAGTVTTTQGVVVTGNVAGDASVGVSLGTLASGGGTATVTFEVTIADPLPAGVSQIVNQGVVSGSNFPDVLTDDPTPPADDDPTVTIVTITPPVGIPALSEWALILFSLLLAAAALRTLRP